MISGMALIAIDSLRITLRELPPTPIREGGITPYLVHDFIQDLE